MSSFFLHLLYVFPMHVGINRLQENGMKHMLVFPMHVGINRARNRRNDTRGCVPHARGD